MSSDEIIGKRIISILISLRKQSGTVDFDTVGKAFKEFSNKDISEEAKDELESLLKFVGKVKSETQMTLVDGDGSKLSDSASNQFEAILKNTEEATDTIIDSISEIGEIVREKLEQSADEESIEKFESEVSKIYEACNFQDLTSQRIGKVNKIIDTIEKRLNEISLIFNKSLPYDLENEDSNIYEINEGESLLNGPQTPENMPSQDEIDALFNSM